MHRIVVSMPQWVGDTVMSVPSLKLLRETLGKETEITLLLLAHLKPVVDDLLCFDEVMTYRKNETKSVSGLFALCSRLKERKFDAALVLSNSFRSALPPFLAGIPLRCGYEGDWRGFMLSLGLEDSHSKKENRYTYTGDYLCALTRFFLENSGYSVPAGNPLPELLWSNEVYRSYLEYRKQFPEGRKRIGIIPASSFGPSRLWSGKSFAEVADRLVSEGHSVNFLYGPGEEKVTEGILRQMREKLEMPPMVPLAELKPFIKELDLILTGDTGPRHYAAALKTPTVIVMGPTSPEISVSRHDDILILRKAEYDCVPCNKPVCSADRHKCMEDVTPDDVCAAISSLLSREGKGHQSDQDGENRI